MLVYVLMPSARPWREAQRVVDAWRDMGYGVVVQREDGHNVAADLCIMGWTWRGYPRAINALAKMVLEDHPDCRIILAGADDVHPCPDKRADEIEAEFIAHFGGTLGVMQPDGHSDWSANALRIAWSAWIGREFCERAYGGEGPFWHGYFHLFSDGELHEVATALGLMWRRPDLTQRHDHWRRRKPKVRPKHLHNAAQKHNMDKALFEARRAAGFPGSGLVP